MFASCSDCIGVSGINSGIDGGGVIIRSEGRGDSRAAASFEGLILNTSGSSALVVPSSLPFVLTASTFASSIGVSDLLSVDFDFPHNPCKVDEWGIDFFAGLRFLDFFVTGSGSSTLPQRERGVDCLSDAVVMVFIEALMV